MLTKLHAVKEIRDRILNLKATPFMTTDGGNIKITAKIEDISLSGFSLQETKALVEEIMRLGVREFMENPEGFLQHTGNPRTGKKVLIQPSFGEKGKF